MRWLQESWAVVQPVWLEVILAFLVVQLVLAVGFALCILPGLLLIGPLTGGLFVYMARQMHGLPTKIGDVFSGMSRFADTTILALVLFLVPAVFAGIMFIPSILAAAGSGAGDPSSVAGFTSCFGMIGVILFMLVYPILVGTFCVFAYPLVMFRRMGAMDALKTSYEVVKPRFVEFLLLLAACALLLIVASSVGGALVCIGTLVLTPLANAVVIGMLLAAYRDFFGLDRANVEQYG